MMLFVVDDIVTASLTPLEAKNVIVSLTQQLNAKEPLTTVSRSIDAANGGSLILTVDMSEYVERRN